MARPRLDEEERRARTVGVRVTAAEAAELRERAQAAGLSMGAYLRRRALGQRVRIAAELRLGAAELRELNRIGVNLNQMARALNSRAVSSPVETHHPESAERVEWTETRNLATSEGERVGRIMAATAEASPELKCLAGVAATGRKLEKPDRQEMRRAAQESLKALGMERHQALVVSHRDGQPHVHVIANRVDPESGKAAGLNRSKLKLSKWAEEYERGQGKIRCPQRERNNARRGQGKRVQDRVSRPTGRHRREEMNPQQEERQAIPAGRDGWGGPERERVAWQRAEERGEWEQLQRRRGKALGELEKRSKREWSALYGRHHQQREYLAKDCRGVLGRFRLWRELGGGVREIGGAIRGQTEVLGAGFVGKRAFRSGAGDREQGGRILPRGPGRVGETGAGGGAVERALTGFLQSS